MINEIAQWVALALIGTLLLGVLRQVSLLMPRRETVVESGPKVGARMPRALQSEVARALAGNGASDGEVMIAFVTENCAGCQRLLAQAEQDSGERQGQPLILVSEDPSPPFRAALEGTGLPLITSSEAWRECEVTATPLVVRAGQDGIVQAKEVTHRVEKVAQASS